MRYIRVKSTSTYASKIRPSIDNRHAFCPRWTHPPIAQPESWPPHPLVKRGLPSLVIFPVAQHPSTGREGSRRVRIRPAAPASTCSRAPSHRLTRPREPALIILRTPLPRILSPPSSPSPPHVPPGRPPRLSPRLPHPLPLSLSPRREPCNSIAPGHLQRGDEGYVINAEAQNKDVRAPTQTHTNTCQQAPTLCKSHRPLMTSSDGHALFCRERRQLAPHGR